MIRAPYRLAETTGERARLGLVVLQVDETIEHDFRRMFDPREVALHVTRVPSGATLTRETILPMEAALPGAAGLLPGAAAFDAVAYACTSGATLIGGARVGALVRDAVPTRHVTDPLAAALSAFRALGVRSVGVVSPYVAPVAAQLLAAFESAGLATPVCAGFEESVEAKVARIDPASTAAAARRVGASAEVEAVFLSCTNLRTLDVIDALEAELGKPVVASNQALAWEMARLAGDVPFAEAPGRLLRETALAAAVS